MMAAEFRKSVQQSRISGQDRLDLRSKVDREHSTERKLKLLARYAYLGGQDADRLPCAFRTIGDEIEVSANRGVLYDPLVRADRNMVLGCAAALFRLRIAIQHVGYLPIVRTFPDPLEADRLAVIRLGPRREPAAAVEAMFDRMQMSAEGAGLQAPDAGASDLDLDALRIDARREGALLKVVRMTDPDPHAPVDILDAGSIAKAEDVRFIVCTSRDLTPDHLNAGQAVQRILLGPAGPDLQSDESSDLLLDSRTRYAFREVLGAWPQAVLSWMA